MSATSRSTTDLPEENEATIRRWVEEASGGFLMVRSITRNLSGGNVAIGRADGRPLDGERVKGSTLDGMAMAVLFDIYVPRITRITRRSRITARKVQAAVLRVLRRYVAEPPDDAWSALIAFERQTKRQTNRRRLSIFVRHKVREITVP